MKKILLVLLSFVSFDAFGATFNCQKQKLPGGKAENSNEYLYVSNSDHEQDMAFVCGHLTTSGCDSSYYIYVRGVHYWKGGSVSGTHLYSCDYQKGWGDTWVQIGFDHINKKCESLQGKEFVAVINEDKRVYASGSVIRLPSSDYVVAKEFCYTDEEKVQPVVVEQTCEQLHCSGVSGDALTKCHACCAVENEITWNGSDCSCKDGNKNFDVATRRCVAKGGNNSQTCRDRRDSAAGKACCDLPDNVATWDGSKCNCRDGKEFKISEQGKGQCVVPVIEEEENTFECPDGDIVLFNKWKINCASHAATISLITQIEALCSSGNATAKKYNDLYVKLTASVAINCQQTVVVEEPKPDNSEARAKIIAAGGVLDSMVASFEANVWKNAQGEFNTARLASDSIAGVVLGTAGGLITSSVMKKHQVEDGFEDLKCVIGGQPVAGWGDEFRVGIQ